MEYSVFEGLLGLHVIFPTIFLTMQTSLWLAGYQQKATIFCANPDLKVKSV